MAIVDFYDALISNRVYNKSNLGHEKTVTLISRSRGLNFDPDLVDAFLEIREEFGAIRLEFGVGKQRD